MINSIWQSRFDGARVLNETFLATNFTSDLKMDSLSL